jgi:hypothetical protein
LRIHSIESGLIGVGVGVIVGVTVPVGEAVALGVAVGVGVRVTGGVEVKVGSGVAMAVRVACATTTGVGRVLARAMPLQAVVVTSKAISTTEIKKVRVDFIFRKSTIAKPKLDQKLVREIARKQAPDALYMYGEGSGDSRFSHLCEAVVGLRRLTTASLFCGVIAAGGCAMA